VHRLPREKPFVQTPLSILPLDKLSNPGFLEQPNCQMTKVAIRIYQKNVGEPWVEGWTCKSCIVLMLVLHNVSYNNTYTGLLTIIELVHPMILPKNLFFLVYLWLEASP
jgi:hypothetical protein